MSQAVSRGQALQIAARVGIQINWDELDGDNLQANVINLKPGEFGARFTSFLRDGCALFEADAFRETGEYVVNIEMADPNWNPFRFDKFLRQGAKVEDLSRNEDVTLHLGTILHPDEKELTNGDEIARRIELIRNIALGYNHALWFTGHGRDEGQKSDFYQFSRAFGEGRIYFPAVIALLRNHRYTPVLFYFNGEWDCRWEPFEITVFRKCDRIAVRSFRRGYTPILQPTYRSIN